ncbi:hypothetical protein [Rhizobium sp. AN80A]|uniref:hypothetical protein n=1 Tax=Rhizobium sp. AN80A TaxID=3040673 RepID=UPI0024B35E16|nr:hypothetical protein [Rhizobium sp. AN80A]
MKKLITAAVVAIASFGATAMPSFADSVTVRIGQPGYHERYKPRPYYNRSYRQHSARSNCRMKTVKYRSHGKLVTETTRVCR